MAQPNVTHNAFVPARHPRTAAERQAKYVESGRQIACVIRDLDALAALERLAHKHGGVTAAVTYALRESR